MIYGFAAGRNKLGGVKLITASAVLWYAVVDFPCILDQGRDIFTG